MLVWHCYLLRTAPIGMPRAVLSSSDRFPGFFSFNRVSNSFPCQTEQQHWLSLWGIRNGTIYEYCYTLSHPLWKICWKTSAVIFLKSNRHAVICWHYHMVIMCNMTSENDNIYYLPLYLHRIQNDTQLFYLMKHDTMDSLLTNHYIP